MCAVHKQAKTCDLGKRAQALRAPARGACSSVLYTCVFGGAAFAKGGGGGKVSLIIIIIIVIIVNHHY